MERIRGQPYNGGGSSPLPNTTIGFGGCDQLDPTTLAYSCHPWGENITLTFQTFKLQEHIHVRACISSSCSVAILMSGLDVRISQILPWGP